MQLEASRMPKISGTGETVDFCRARAHLALIDADWARLIHHIGPCALQPSLREPYEALIRAVAYQQLHARAADAIIARFLNLYSISGSETTFPLPDQVVATRDGDLRSCGFSMRKIATIKGIAEGALNELVPSLDVSCEMQDDELIARLITLPGIGRWTVEMFLMHTLGRMDILPADDLGVRDGYRFLKSMSALPTPKELEKAGLRCSPYRTVASWYLWRVAFLPDYVRMTKKK
jgi:DNA-3-methyladenine glycosylase II